MKEIKLTHRFGDKVKNQLQTSLIDGDPNL